MSTLNFIITDAGRQAAIDADATGVQLTLTEVGYGTGNWSPDKTATALQSEFKRLPAGGGDNPAPLYVHIAVTDQSSDTYQGNEVSVYAGNVLFAIWSKGLQPDTDGPGKISSGDSAFVFDLLLDNVPPGSVTVGDANFSNPLATETVPGIIQKASLEDMLALINDDAITVQKFKAWWDSVKDGLTDRIVGNELYFLGKEDPRFFTLNGSTIVNGVIDFPLLAKSGSPFISISGNNIILMDVPDFVRPIGSTNRLPGDYERDTMMNITGDFNASANTHGSAGVIFNDNDARGAFKKGSKQTTTALAQISGFYCSNLEFDASREVPTGPQFQPRSRSSYLAIWHGEKI
ncbi:hypothetical protein [Endozoicomonas sp. ALB115]|uniref:hypothetical protein n=1 Tax=Endozoicomonas sp. ALB115 TaxID=3403074 RepID=UPI003BB50547